MPSAESLKQKYDRRAVEQLTRHIGQHLPSKSTGKNGRIASANSTLSGSSLAESDEALELFLEALVHTPNMSSRMIEYLSNLPRAHLQNLSKFSTILLPHIFSVGPERLSVILDDTTFLESLEDLGTVNARMTHYILQSDEKKLRVLYAIPFPVVFYLLSTDPHFLERILTDKKLLAVIRQVDIKRSCAIVKLPREVLPKVFTDAAVLHQLLYLHTSILKRLPYFHADVLSLLLTNNRLGVFLAPFFAKSKGLERGCRKDLVGLLEAVKFMTREQQLRLINMRNGDDVLSTLRNMADKVNADRGHGRAHRDHSQSKSSVAHIKGQATAQQSHDEAFGVSMSSSTPVKRDDSTSITYMHSRRRFPQPHSGGSRSRKHGEKRSACSERSTRATDIQRVSSNSKLGSHSKKRRDFASEVAQLTTEIVEVTKRRQSSSDGRDVSFGRSRHSSKRVSTRSQSPSHKCRKEVGQHCCCESTVHECRSYEGSSHCGDQRHAVSGKHGHHSQHDHHHSHSHSQRRHGGKHAKAASSSSTSAQEPTPVVGADHVLSHQNIIKSHEAEHAGDYSFHAHSRSKRSRSRSTSSSSSSSGSNSRPSMVDGMPVRYVEVPTIEYVEKHVPKKEVVFTERRVPKKVIENIEKIVEVPEVREVIKEVEVPIHLMKPREEPVVIAQSIQPVVTASKRFKEVHCNTFDPVVVPVDIYIPLPVHTLDEGDAIVKVHHERVPRQEVPQKQWNSLVFSVNKGHEADFLDDMLIRDATGQIQTLAPMERCDVVPPLESWKPV